MANQLATVTDIAKSCSQPEQPARNLYLLILGIVAGMMLGPYALGRLYPQTYEQWFIGGIAELEAHQQFMFDTLANVARQESAGVSEAALLEYNAARDSQAAVLWADVQAAQFQKKQWLLARMTALILAMLVIMVGEGLFGRHEYRLRAALATTRYALMALWLALLIAAPDLLIQVPIWFVAALLIVALVAGLAPLKRRNTG